MRFYMITMKQQATCNKRVENFDEKKLKNSKKLLTMKVYYCKLAMRSLGIGGAKRTFTTEYVRL